MGNDEIYSKASLFCFLFVNMYVVFGFSTCLLNCPKKLNYFQERTV
jgi:hypothetical protein